jgi:hypothetical protein
MARLQPRNDATWPTTPAARSAAGVPLYYSTVQLVLIAVYLFVCWRREWTYAPATDPLWRVLKEPYQHRCEMRLLGGASAGGRRAMDDNGRGDARWWRRWWSGCATAGGGPWARGSGELSHKRVQGDHA